MKRLISLLAVALGCATAPIDDGRPPDVELDPLVLRVNHGKVEALDAKSAFQAASDAYARAEHEDAARRFDEVARLFPDTRYAPHARYNAGLALLQLTRWKEALVHLIEAEKLLASDADRLDASCQIGLCFERLESWEDLRGAAQRVLDRKKLPVRERVEARARLGIALYQLGDWARAERALEEAVEDHRRNPGVPSLKGNVLVAQAQFLIGEIYRELFRSIRFRLPVESMRRDLNDKSAFFLEAQNAYLGCIRLSAARWSVAAGYRLGELYEGMFDDMMAAEVPADLDEEDRRIYFGELKGYVRPLVERAVDIYERSLSMADRIGGAAEWSEKSRKGLDRMRDILRNEFGREGVLP